MNYINYHSHSQYSNTSTPDSTISNEDRVKRVVELGMTVFSGVEHGNSGKFIEVIELSKQYNVKPLLGTEAYFVKDRLQKDTTNAHIILLAKNEKGRKAINLALSEANETGFYYKPRVDLEILLKMPKNDVWVTSACLGGVWKYEDYEDLIIQINNHFQENFFLEAQSHNVDKQKEINKEVLRLSKKYNIKIMAGVDSHMIYPSQIKERDDYLLSRGISYPDEDNWYLDFPNYEELLNRFKKQGVLSYDQTIESLNNTNVFENVEVYNSIIFDEQMIKLPTLYPDKSQEWRNKNFEDLIWEKWKKEKINVPEEKWNHYQEEIKKEVSVIVETNMSDYFLLDYEIVKRGIEKGGHITLTSRGSAPSFYTSKLLGFTTIDRISSKVKLFPERFITKERILETGSLPDLDLNVSDPSIFAEAQNEILGNEHAYPMITYGTMKSSGAWKLYSRTTKLNFEEANSVSEQIKEYEMALKYADEEEKETISIYSFIEEKHHKIYDESLKYLNLVNSTSIHPCAYLLYNHGNIKEEFGLIRIRSSASNSDNLCVNCDGLFAEKYKMLKNDLLKVDVVDLIYRTYNLINIKPHTIPELIEVCDKNNKVWDIYKNGHTIGINQFEKEATTKKGMRYSPKNLSELSAFVASIRPGFQSEYHTFEQRKPFSFGVETLDNIIQTDEFPYSFMLYQENTMAVLAYAGIPIDETYNIIKNIAKKRYEKVVSVKDQFVKGMTKRLIENEKIKKKDADNVSKKTWQVIEDSAYYSFNASHSYSVAGDSLYGAYLKSHYPIQFYTSFIQIMEDKGNKDRILLAKKEAIEAFNINFPIFQFGQDNTKISYDLDNNAISMSLKSIKGFGNKIAEDMLQLSKLFTIEKNSQYNFLNLLMFAEDNSYLSTKFEDLIKIRYFEEFGKNKKLYEFYQEFTSGKNRYSKTHTDKTKEKRIPELQKIWNDIPNKNYSIQEQIKNELEILNEIQTNFPVNKNYAVAIELDLKYSPKIEFQNLLTGERKTFKIKSKVYNEFPINKGDILLFKKVIKKNSMTKNEEGKWIQIEDKFDLWLDVYYIIKENDKLSK